MAETGKPRERAPMTIKAVPVEARQKMAALAMKAGQTMAEWLTQTVEHMERVQAGERVLPPEPARANSGNPPTPNGRTMTIAELGEAMAAAAAAAQASGLPLPKQVARHAYAMLNGHLRAARGLPELPRRQTARRIGQTIEADASPDQGF